MIRKLFTRLFVLTDEEIVQEGMAILEQNSVQELGGSARFYDRSDDVARLDAVIEIATFSSAWSRAVPNTIGK